MNFIVKLLAGIFIGSLLGLYSPEFIVRIALTIRDAFGQFLTFVIPFLILIFIVNGIADLKKNSGKTLGITLMLTYASTLLAGLSAFVIATLFLPNVISQEYLVTEASQISPLVNIFIEPVMGVVTALLIAFMFGLGIAKTQSNSLKLVFSEAKSIIDLIIIKIIIPLLPLYIATIFCVLAYDSTAFNILKLFSMVLILIFTLQWMYLTCQYTVAGILTKRNPLKLIKNVLPAYFTAIGTMSSIATIPVSLASAKKNKVKDYVANFTIPLCANIHVSGSMITIIVCALAIMSISNELNMPTFIEFIPVIFMLAIVIAAAPGVPGGVVMSAIGILSLMLGFDETAIALMIALYMAQDSFGTATNITGDGAISLIVDKYTKNP